jgi:hypothetical protein
MQVAVEEMSPRLNEVADHPSQKEDQMKDRISRLEAQAAALNAEIAALKAGKPAPPPAPVKELREVSITELHTERAGGPNLAELKKLYAAVRNLVPEAKHHDPDAGFRGFCGAYRFVSNCGRVAAPNAKVSISWWLDNMIDWLRQRGAVALDATGASFVAAVYAAGDVLFVPHNGTLGTVWEFGLVLPGQSGGSGGKPASDAWRRILRDGASAVLPSSVPVRRIEAPSQVRIYGGR